jgi:hypothetical protein
MAVLDTVVTELRHHVLARHASTGEPLAPLLAVLQAAPPDWHVEVKGPDVVVSARHGTPAPAAPPTVRLTVGGSLAPWLQPATDTVPLTAPAIVHDFQPAPMTLTVELVKKADGKPAIGLNVTAHGSAEAPVTLPELAAEPGTYRSPARVWAAAFHPLELRIAGVKVVRLAIDFTRTDTRVRVVDPT